MTATSLYGVTYIAALRFEPVGVMVWKVVSIIHRRPHSKVDKAYHITYVEIHTSNCDKMSEYKL